MKNFLAIIFGIFMISQISYTQEINFSGEVKTGFYIEQEKIGSQKPLAKGGATNNDGDSGGGAGRIRLDFNFVYDQIGLRFRFQIDPVGGSMGPYLPKWNYAYAYGKLFDEQLTISAGLLGESPWGTIGPKIRSEPETREYFGFNDLSGEQYIANEGLMGIRFEYKPFFVPGLNLGLVLNQPDQVTFDVQAQKFADMLLESVIGIAYKHDYFSVRLGYRMDSKPDTYRNTMNEGSRLLYSIEEHFLNTIADGMRIWLYGCYYGIGCEQQTIDKMINGSPVKVTLGSGEYFINWLHWLWDAQNFLANADVCFSVYKSYNNDSFRPIERQQFQSIELFPAFYYKFFDNNIQVGIKLGFCMEFGAGKTFSNSLLQYYQLEPKIQLNLGTNAYIAAVYNYTDKYAWFDVIDIGRRGEKAIKHSLNIRASYTF